MDVEFRGLATFGISIALAEQGVIYLLVADSCHSDLAGNWISPEAALDVAERFFVCRS